MNPTLWKKPNRDAATDVTQGKKPIGQFLYKNIYKNCFFSHYLVIE